MKGMLRILAVVAMVASAWGLVRAAGPATAPAARAGVSDQEKLEFTQGNAQAQMQELENRMFHLAEVVKDAEPESSTRLLLAVRKARDQQIMEQMREVLAKLTTKNLLEAADQSKEVLVKLNELRNLLTSTDLEFQLQLERLRKLNAAIAKVDTAIKEEKHQQNHTSNLADQMKKGSEVKPGTLNEAKKDQEKNRDRTDEVNKSLKELGNLDSAMQPLSSASQSMSQAEGSLGAGKPGEASPQQSEATKKLQEARDQLEKERQKTVAELQKQIKKVVMENLQEMLDRQTGVRQATETLSPQLAKSRAALQQLQQLAPAEERIAKICQSTLDLVNESEFSVALPPALEELQRNMMYVMGDLAGGRGGERVIATEMGIEQDLRALLETFKEMSEDGKPGKCKGCKGNKNKLLAELKVVRLLQLRVNKDTLDAEAEANRARAAKDLPAELREKIGKVRDGEGAARDAMEKLHKQYGPGAPDEPEEGEGTRDNPL